ncbi:hypothetical protein V4F39_05320 [Aquincola sp. MAHUQ-54]|uniref:Metallo-beta-lactamase domain-containing protein n=1 Tax=Aquincola agrisoli TaxID=3119538 RepID=A0AAW9QD38_9BURK
MAALRQDPGRRFGQRLRGAARSALAAALAASAFGAVAAAAAGAQALTAEPIKPGLYRIQGADGAALLRLDGTGIILVDAHRAGTYRPLMAEVQRIAKAPGAKVGAVALTAAGPQEAGNVPQFVEGGVPVIVQQQAAAKLAADAKAQGAAGPLVTYGTDYLLRVGGLEAEVEHVGKGRTGVDSVVWFRDLRAVAVGGLYTAGTPEPDCASGGSLAGWAAAITHLLWFDFDVAVPTRGAPVGKPELLALKSKLEAMAARAAASPQAQAGCSAPPG